MGHERVGTLPKTQRWRDLVQQIASLHTHEIEVSDIARQTIKNVRSRFRYIHSDPGVNAAFKFLVALSVTSCSPNPHKELLTIGIEIPDNPTPLSFAKAVHTWVATKRGSFEYSQIAQSAAGDAIAAWCDKNKPKQDPLFKSLDNPLELWRKAANGAGFCELARLFFAKFTERYLNYFLEREVSADLRGVHERDQFRRQLHEHLEKISQHAFETAKTTQSFAAGWFNKYASQGIPNEETIESFLSLAFGKIRDELIREGEE